jgi:hypothetical protein
MKQQNVIDIEFADGGHSLWLVELSTILQEIKC